MKLAHADESAFIRGAEASYGCFTLKVAIPCSDPFAGLSYQRTVQR
jgi:hypothetical protein